MKRIIVVGKDSAYTFVEGCDKARRITDSEARDYKRQFTNRQLPEDELVMTDDMMVLKGLKLNGD